MITQSVPEKRTLHRRADLCDSICLHLLKHDGLGAFDVSQMLTASRIVLTVETMGGTLLPQLPPWPILLPSIFHTTQTTEAMSIIVTSYRRRFMTPTCSVRVDEASGIDGSTLCSVAGDWGRLRGIRTNCSVAYCGTDAVLASISILVGSVVQHKFPIRLESTVLDISIERIFDMSSNVRVG